LLPFGLKLIILRIWFANINKQTPQAKGLAYLQGQRVYHLIDVISMSLSILYLGFT
jgi:hypothetical protein